MIRVFQLMNIRPDTPVDEKYYSYLALGTFDAMETWLAEDDEIHQVISDPFGYAILKEKAVPNAECVYVIGFRDEEPTEMEFWHSSGFLFFSSIQLKEEENLQMIAERIEDETNKEEGKRVKVYFTLDQSSLLVCLKTDRYHKGYQTVMGYERFVKEINHHNAITHGSTIVMFPKGAAPDSDERVNLLLHCLVKDRLLANGLKTKLTEKCEEIENIAIDSFGLFGQDDKLIHISNLPVPIWISFYNGSDPMIRCSELERFGLGDLRTEVLESDGENN